MTKDVYIWKVTYRDGTVLSEYDELRSDGRGFAEVEGEIKELSLFQFITDPAAFHRVQIPEGATPVFFRRRKISVDPATSLYERSNVAHCIGWKRDEQACYLFIHEDGSTLLTSDLQAV